ncbi:MAG: hypothetical protein AUK47_19525 [Deltaproteobacteria bacterium CG2_30_63_29]|nr:MAG: hypothetical protein AUK47_19525 [Deltaproteobacteria bacterium CG2_30_63_29]PJB48875.1 MAG: hypothetical protein CO108_01445 [Deltaproteobacteria bacterium CG_4_9_14_3_um_filter_63_12]
MKIRFVMALMLSSGLVFGACVEEESLPRGFSDVQCTSCHGTESVSVAPPLAIDKESATTDPGVGAHQSHLQGGNLRGPIQCSDCHQVPEFVDSEGHHGALPAELSFGALATANGNLAPEFDDTTYKCTNVYCHGAIIGGGSNKTPQWNVVDGSQRACGTCHGFPPPAPHLQLTYCTGCHPDTVNEDGSINLTTGYHINGVIDAPF